MNIGNLYEDYGRLSIQAEIVNGQLMETKKKIAEELNNPNKPEMVKKEEDVEPKENVE